mmetsp:Transcript_61546/g.133202  ORF Transcript_61546/g.133202 Transcript_61546/m.133202 type:complete len:421 (-) Transcript_61546:101-1363(-)
MTTFINYSSVGDDDATVQGAEWLQRTILQQQGPEAEQEFVNKFQEVYNALESSRFDYGPVFDLFVEHSEELFHAKPEVSALDLESFFALVLQTLLQIEDQDHLERAVQTLCDLFSGGSGQAELRLRLLMMLYNTWTPPTRYRVFKRILEHAAKTELFDQVVGYLEHLDDWMEEWAPVLTVEDKRELHCNISSYMRAMGKRVDAFQHLKKYSLLFQGESSEACNAKPVREVTIQLLKDAVQLPTVIQFDDILAYDTVKALATTKTDHKDLVDLCKVFLSGTVNDLRDFHTKNKKLFGDKEDQLSFEDTMSKIRLLTLATLAHGRAEIDLAEVAAALEESEDNVEPWVVRAISEGVIDGRIDQLNRKVLVKSSFQRTFEKKEWAFLDTKLSQWIDNLENVIVFIGEQKALKNSTMGALAGAS